jgi:hypothetical protein
MAGGGAVSLLNLKRSIGDQAERGDLNELINDWLQLSDIQEGAKLAKVSADSTQKIA